MMHVRDNWVQSSVTSSDQMIPHNDLLILCPDYILHLLIFVVILKSDYVRKQIYTKTDNAKSIIGKYDNLYSP